MRPELSFTCFSHRLVWPWLLQQTQARVKVWEKAQAQEHAVRVAALEASAEVARRERQAEAEATAAEEQRLEEDRRAVEERKARMVGRRSDAFQLIVYGLHASRLYLLFENGPLPLLPGRLQMRRPVRLSSAPFSSKCKMVLSLRPGSALQQTVYRGPGLCSGRAQPASSELNGSRLCR